MGGGCHCHRERDTYRANRPWEQRATATENVTHTGQIDHGGEGATVTENVTETGRTAQSTRIQNGKTEL